MTAQVREFLTTHYDFRYNLLTDPTGSRRYLCVEVKHVVRCTGIDHDQLFAQLKAELQAGKRHWFTHAEELRILRENLTFQQRTPVEDMVRTAFRSPKEGEKPFRLSAAEIYAELQQKNPAALRGCTSTQFGLLLVRVGLKRKHTEWGNVYEVMRR